MSDRMRQMPFLEIINQAMTEYSEKGSMFYVPVTKPELQDNKVFLSGTWIESPVGPAAGPHTQLAQNIIAAYAGGARYFELKTVQVLSGEALGIQKPCIYINGDEAYNTEWSSELTSDQALEEYIKAWITLKLLIKEYNLGDENGFVFNMSVGYSLEGIQSESMDYYLESMMNASSTEIFKQCIQDALSILTHFKKITKDYVEKINPYVSNTISLSTMHGCPVEEIEKIAFHLLLNKRLNTYLKCNPTLLGVGEIRAILQQMGYGYLSFTEEMFHKDLEFEKAVALIKRLQIAAREHGLEFGVKLTNTFPVKILEKELSGEMMYMSGPALYPLSIGVAAKLANAIGEDLRISYSGGADPNNIGAIYETGIYPITVSTLLLKSGGYKNLNKLNQATIGHKPRKLNFINLSSLSLLATEARMDQNYYKKKSVVKPKERKPGNALVCSKCNNCVDTCPNRANFRIDTGMEKYVLHLEERCNECGNCSCFCPSGYEPYLEKFTLYIQEKEFYDSLNPGYCLEQEELLRYDDKIYRINSGDGEAEIPGNILQLIELIKGR